MRTDARTVFQVLCIGSGLASLAVLLYVQFSNPDMTVTRLLVNFWPVYLIGVGVTGLFAYLWLRR